MTDMPTKPTDEGGVETINLRVSTQDGNAIHFKCKMTTPMGKLMSAFCERQGVEMHPIRFLFDDCRIMQDQTPIDLEMEDGDSIDAMIEHQGC
mmetsp:Transcript_21221/g.53788  ORF Transcript_21221/g.53788 Transcript_21221/m.53788 type:complete len:93 (+) Transcript_21221:586-864(+)